MRNLVTWMVEKKCISLNASILYIEFVQDNWKYTLYNIPYHDRPFRRKEDMFPELSVFFSTVKNVLYSECGEEIFFQFSRNVQNCILYEICGFPEK